MSHPLLLPALTFLLYALTLISPSLALAGHLQTPHQAAGQPFKFTIPESLDRIKEEFQFLQAQYHRCVTTRSGWWSLGGLFSPGQAARTVYLVLASRRWRVESQLSPVIHVTPSWLSGPPLLLSPPLPIVSPLRICGCSRESLFVYFGVA